MCVHVKAARTSIKLGSGSGSHSSPSSLLPYPRDQCTTHKCLPLSPTAPPTLLTWPSHGIMGVTVLTVRAGYCYYTFQKHRFTSTIFLSNNHSVNNVGQQHKFWMTDMGKWHFEERCMQYNYTLFIWMLWWDRRKINHTCRKTMHTGTMDRGFTVFTWNQRSMYESCVHRICEHYFHKI
jgi:hypothetical protein